MSSEINVDLNQSRLREVSEKRHRLQNFMQANHLDGVLLNTHSFFAWATGGGVNWVATDTEQGITTLLYMADGRQFAFTNNIEVPRMQHEEFLTALGYEVISQEWWQNAASKTAAIWDVAGGKNKLLGADYELDEVTNLGGELAQLRWQLTHDEIERYRLVCADAAQALEETCANLTPGTSEWEIAGQLAQANFQRGLLPFVTLVATDERIFKYRHPVPTFKKLQKYAMVVLCAKRGGLIANCTRLVHFGALSTELQQKQTAILEIDTTFNLNTQPGAKVNEIFAKGQAAYTQFGYGQEWQLHHQGGATGYQGRDYLGTPTSQELVLDNQAFAWNPSIAGIKAEDTVLVSKERGCEVLTTTANSSWPTSRIEIPGLGQLNRALVLEK